MMNTHKQNEASQNRARSQPGYTTSINEFKDPRTREIFAYNIALLLIKSEYPLQEVINFIIKKAGEQCQIVDVGNHRLVKFYFRLKLKLVDLI